MAVIDIRHGLPDNFGTDYNAIPREYSEDEWHKTRDMLMRLPESFGATYPHCDMRVLHAPGECVYCDLHAGEQEDRLRACVAFTGHRPLSHETACPADLARPPDSSSDHRRWPGNRKPT